MSITHIHKLNIFQQLLGKLLISDILKFLDCFQLKDRHAIYIIGSVGSLEPCFVYKELPDGQLQVIDVISDVDVVLSPSIFTLVKQTRWWVKKTIVRRVEGNIFYKGYTEVKINIGFIPIILMQLLRINSIFTYESASLGIIHKKYSPLKFKEQAINCYDIFNLIINKTHELIILLYERNDSYKVIKAIRKIAKIVYGYMLDLGLRPRSMQQVLELLSFTDFGKKYPLFKTTEFTLIAKGAVSDSQLNSLCESKIMSDINYCLYEFVIKNLLPNLLKRVRKGCLLKFKLIILEVLRRLLGQNRSLTQSVYLILKYGLTIDDLIKLKLIIDNKLHYS
ncbi:MAG: hypothetical protein QXF82_04440 [Nitrososphaeria archaeon]